MSQTDSHDPTQGELSGEVTNRLLMDMPQSPRRAQNRLLTAIGVFLFLVVLGGIGFGLFTYLQGQQSSGVYFPDMTYVEFSNRLSTKEIDPRGADHIYYQRVEAPEGEIGEDVWMKMEIQSNSYEAMLKKQKDRMDALKASGVDVKDRTVGQIEIAPAEWTRSTEYPTWWIDIQSSVGVSRTKTSIWTVRLPGKTAGELWAFDPAKNSAWIWKWEGPVERPGDSADPPEDFGEPDPVEETPPRVDG
jgi:hypothetical protein